MIKVIIIEDEFYGQEFARKTLMDNFPEIEIVGIEKKAKDAAELINRSSPDLVFLDVEIIGGTGFDVLAAVKDRNFEIIFVTAYNEYAIRAIKESALDYFLKPIVTADFIEGVRKAIDKIENRKLSEIKKEGKFAITTSKGVEYVYADEIVYLEADGGYTNVITSREKILSSKNIGEYERLLRENKFFRCHHSFIINVTKINSVIKNRSGLITMENGDHVPVAQRRMKKLNDYL
jgi:two-component system LytT family response regulator